MIRIRFSALFFFLVLTIYSPPLFSSEKITTKKSHSPTVLSWQILSEMDSKTGKMPASLHALKNTEVQIAGFIVPIEMGDSIDKVSVFALVPDPLSCIHIPPPPPNQMIYVTMDTPIDLDMDFRGVSVNGTLSVAQPKVKALLVGYELKGTKATKATIDFDFNAAYQKAHELKDGITDDIFDNITDEVRLEMNRPNSTDPNDENFFYTDDLDEENPVEAKNLEMLNEGFE